MSNQIKFTATLIVTPAGEAATDAESARAYAEGEMDHVADLLYDSGDTVYRYEVIEEGEAGDETSAAQTPAALIQAVENLLQQLKTQLPKK